MPDLLDKIATEKKGDLLDRVAGLKESEELAGVAELTRPQTRMGPSRELGVMPRDTGLAVEEPLTKTGLPRPKYISTPKDIRPPYTAPEGTPMRIGPAPEPKGYVKPVKPPGWEYASPIEKAVYGFNESKLNYLAERFGKQLANSFARIGETIISHPLSPIGIKASETESFREQAAEELEKSGFTGSPPDAELLIRQRASALAAAERVPKFGVEPPVATSEKAVDVGAGLTSFIAQLGLLKWIMPTGTSPPVIWEIQNQLTGGIPGQGAAMRLALGGVGKIPVGSLKGKLAKVGLESGLFAGYTAATGGSAEDIIISGLIPVTFNAWSFAKQRQHIRAYEADLKAKATQSFDARRQIIQNSYKEAIKAAQKAINPEIKKQLFTQAETQRRNAIRGSDTFLKNDIGVIDNAVAKAKQTIYRDDAFAPAREKWEIQRKRALAMIATGKPKNVERGNAILDFLAKVPATREGRLTPQQLDVMKQTKAQFDTIVTKGGIEAKQKAKEVIQKGRGKLAVLAGEDAAAKFKTEVGRIEAEKVLLRAKPASRITEKPPEAITPEIPTVAYRAGDLEAKVSTPPDLEGIYFADHKEMAKAYTELEGATAKEVKQYKIELKNPATEEIENQVARELGVPSGAADVEGLVTPYGLPLYDEQSAVKVAQELKKRGYDGVIRSNGEIVVFDKSSIAPTPAKPTTGELAAREKGTWGGLKVAYTPEEVKRYAPKDYALGFGKEYGALEGSPLAKQIDELLAKAKPAPAEAKVEKPAKVAEKKEYSSTDDAKTARAKFDAYWEWHEKAGHGAKPAKPEDAVFEYLTDQGEYQDVETPLFELDEKGEYESPEGVELQAKLDKMQADLLEKIQTLAEIEKPAEKEIKPDEITKPEEAIIKPATSLEVEPKKTGEPVSEGAGQLDPTNYEDALEITRLHADWVAGKKDRPVWDGIYSTKWDKEKLGYVKDVVDYTPEEVDTAYRAVQKPIPSPIADTKLFAMPGKESKLAAIGEKMSKLSKRPRKTTKSPGLLKAKNLPRAKTEKKDHIKAVFRAAAKEDTRYAINGVFVEGDTIAATDGRRMFWAKGDWGEDGLYVDVASLKKGVFGKPDKTGKKFPDWKDVVPDTSGQQPILVDDLPGVWNQAQQAKLMTTEESRGIVIIANKDGTLGFAGAGPEVGHAEINIQPGGKILGAVNPDYFLDTIAFHATRGDTSFKFYFPNWDRPILSESQGGKTSTMIMPINVGEEGPMSKAIAEATAEGKPFAVLAEEPSEFEPADMETVIKEEPRHISKIVVDTFREWPEGIKEVGKDYWTEVMAAAKQLLTPLRYRALRKTMLGVFRYKKGITPEVVGVELQDVRDALTSTHELGHNIDWLLSDKKYPRSIKGRFPESAFKEAELRAELKKISQVLRPDMWEVAKTAKSKNAYLNRHSELMADFVSCYILDPEKTEAIAPKTTAAFERKIADSPQIFDIISRLQEVRYADEITPLERHLKEKFPLPKEFKPLQLSVDMSSENYVKAAEKLGITAARHYKLLMNRAGVQADKIDKFVPDRSRQTDLVVLAEEGSKNPWTGKTLMEIRAEGLTDSERKALNLYRGYQELARQTVNKYLRGADVTEYIKFIEDYFIHTYETPLTQKYKNAISKWAKRSPQAKKRVLPDLNAAVELGLTPRAKTLSEGLRLWAGINYRVATNKAFLKILPKITNDEGVSILQKPSDYPHWPTVDYWPIRQTYAVPLGSRGILLFQGRVAVDPRVKPFIDAMFGRRVFSSPVRVIEGLNALWKGFQLTLFSLFHHQAEFFSAAGSLGPRALPFVGGYYGKRARAFGAKKPLGFLPEHIGVLKAGKELEKVPEFMDDYMAAGGQVGYISTEGRNLLERMFKKAEHYLENIVQTKPTTPLTGAFAAAYVPVKTMSAAYTFHQKVLWDNVQRAKLVSYYKIVSDGALNSDLPIEEVKEIAAKYIADNYGGQEWLNTMFRSPKVRQFWTQLMMSLDWTWSQIKTVRWPMGLGAKTAAQRKLMQKIGRHHWFWYFSAVSGFTIAASYAFSGKGPWDNEKGHKLDIDWTNVWRNLPWNKDWKERGDYTHRYIGLGKASREITRWVLSPLKAFGYKMSPVARTFFEQTTGYGIGSDWAEPWAREDLELYQEVSARFKHVMENFKPFAFSGNNAFLAFPSRKGMTQWKAVRSYEEIYKVQAKIAAGGFGAPFAEVTAKTRGLIYGNKDKLIKDIDEACKLNKVDSEKARKAALSGVRSKYYRLFWKSSKLPEKRAIKDCNRYANALLELGVVPRGFKQSLRYREERLPEKAREIGLRIFQERAEKK